MREPCQSDDPIGVLLLVPVSLAALWAAALLAGALL